MADLTSEIWLDTPQLDNPYIAEKSLCHGFDVYGDLLNNAGFVDYLLLLFKSEPPESWEKELLRLLFIAVANLGPRDPSIHAAMCAAVSGSHPGAVLMAAVGVGAGEHGGSGEVRCLVEHWQELGLDEGRWVALLSNAASEGIEFGNGSGRVNVVEVPGFLSYTAHTPSSVSQFLSAASAVPNAKHLRFLAGHRLNFEAAAGSPLAITSVVAALCCDLRLCPELSELLYLWIRLPGAMVHGKEQRALGYKSFPFFNERISIQGAEHS